MKGLWWKLLSVVILLYVLLAGFLVPLRPGVHDVQPDRVLAGDSVWLKVTGYNTSFARAERSVRGWLKLNDEYAIASLQTEVHSEQQVDLLFSVPRNFPLSGEVHPLSLVIQNAADGSFVMPNAVFVRECVFDAAAGRVWSSTAQIGARKTGVFVYPYRNILHETIRNTYFHIPMWFGMMILFFASAVFSVFFIRKNRIEDDLRTVALNVTGTLFGILGLITGMLWSKHTWGAYWSWDVKQNTAAIAVLIYLAYFVLRASMTDPDRKARVSAVYNVFACVMLIPLLFVIPRMTDSLHPGSGGNPAMGGEDLDNTMRAVFYPAVIGWTLLGLWISDLRYRLLKLDWLRIFGK